VESVRKGPNLEVGEQKGHLQLAKFLVVQTAFLRHQATIARLLPLVSRTSRLPLLAVSQVRQLVAQIGPAAQLVGLAATQTIQLKLERPTAFVRSSESIVPLVKLVVVR